MAKSLTELRDRPVVAPDWVITNLLKRQNTAYIIGPPKKGCKSWLTLAACWDLSEGKPLWGVKDKAGAFAFPIPRPMRCVYFTQEDTEDDVTERIRAGLGAGRDANDRFWVVPKDLRIKLDVGFEMILRELDEVKKKAGDIDIVMFDPMREMHHGNENDSETISRIVSRVNDIQRGYNASVWFTHHTGKPPRGDFREGFDPTDPYTGRGSSAIYGSGDAFGVVVPGKLADDKMSRIVSMYYETKRGQQPAPSQFKVDFQRAEVTWLGEAKGKSNDDNSLG